MKNSFKIGKIKISDKNSPLIIPEIGINHNGSLAKAKLLVDSAARAGAKMIKHQTHVPDDEMSYHAKKIKPGNSNKDIFSIIKNASLNENQEFELKEYTEKKGLEYLSTPFSLKSVDRLVEMKVKAFKIGSGECNNFKFVEYVAQKKKPIILSTGMNTLKSISPSVKIIKKYKVPFALLHCTSIYPAPKKLLNLNSIKLLKDKFNCIVGYSDHSKGMQAACTSIALGSSIVEKHYVHTHSTLGPDVVCSMNFKQLKYLLKTSGEIYSTLGDYKGPLKEEAKTIRFAFSSIVAKKNIKKGEFFSRENITFKRPGTGDFKSYEFNKLIGLKSKFKIDKDEQIKKKDIIK